MVGRYCCQLGATSTVITGCRSTPNLGAFPGPCATRTSAFGNTGNPPPKNLAIDSVSRLPVRWAERCPRSTDRPTAADDAVVGGSECAAKPRSDHSTPQADQAHPASGISHANQIPLLFQTGCQCPHRTSRIVTCPLTPNCAPDCATWSPASSACVTRLAAGPSFIQHGRMPWIMCGGFCPRSRPSPGDTSHGPGETRPSQGSEIGPSGATTPRSNGTNHAAPVRAEALRPRVSCVLLMEMGSSTW